MVLKMQTFKEANSKHQTKIFSKYHFIPNLTFITAVTEFRKKNASTDVCKISFLNHNHIGILYCFIMVW